MKKGTVYYDSTGPSGNIYHIIGLVQQEMRKQRRISEFNECRDKVFASQSYEDALAVIREYVNLIDTSKTKASINPSNREKRTNADLEDEFQQYMRTNIQETEMTYVGDTVFEGGTDYEIRAILATQNGGLEESELTLVEALNLDDDSTAYLIMLDGEVDHVEENKTAAEEWYNSYFQDLEDFGGEFGSDYDDDGDSPFVEDDEHYLPTDSTYDGTSMVGALDDEIEELYDEETKKAVGFERMQGKEQLANKVLNVGQRVRVEDDADTWEVVGFWFKDEVVTEDPTVENPDVRWASGVRIKNTKTGQFLNANRFQLMNASDGIHQNASNREKAKSVNASIDWNYFDKFDTIVDKYLPTRGQGDTKASQIVTAVNKLIYKWFNDGDVFDNTYHLEGWANDLSSYANWLSANADDAYPILKGINRVKTEDDYTELLKHLADKLFEDEYLNRYANEDAEGDIYDCDGPFRFEEHYDDDDDEDEEHYDDDDEDEDIYGSKKRQAKAPIKAESTSKTNPFPQGSLLAQAWEKWVENGKPTMTHIIESTDLFFDIVAANSEEDADDDEIEDARIDLTYELFDQLGLLDEDGRKQVKGLIDPKGETQKILSTIKPTVGKEHSRIRDALEKEGFDNFEEGATFSNWAKGNVFVYFQWNKEGKVTYIDAGYSEDEGGVLYEEDYPSGGAYASASNQGRKILTEEASDRIRARYIKKIVAICEELSAGGEYAQEVLLTWINERGLDSNAEYFTDKDFEQLTNEQIRELLAELETIKEETIFDYEDEDEDEDEDDYVFGNVDASAQTDATYKVGDAIEYEKTLAFEKGTQKIKSKIVAINGMRGLTAEGDWISILKDLPIRILSSILGEDNAKITGREAMEKLEESGIEGADILLDEVGTKTYVDWCTYLLDTYVELGEDLVAMGENKQAEENTKTVIAPLKKHISQVSASKTTKNNIQTESADNAPTDGVYNPGDLVFWKEEWKDSGDDKYNFIVVEDRGDRFTYTADPKDQSKKLPIPPVSSAEKHMVARRITDTKIIGGINSNLYESTWGVYKTGGTVGEKTNYFVLSNITEEEARKQARDRNKRLSPGEKSFYKLKYVAKPMTKENINASKSKSILHDVAAEINSDKKYYEMDIVTCGNIDRGQNPYEREESSFTAQSIEECQKLLRKYLDDNGLGGGNFLYAHIRYGNSEKMTSIGVLSYNGRFWEKGSEEYARSLSDRYNDWKINAERKGDKATDFQKIYNEAQRAGIIAAGKKIPTPMVVEEHENMLDGNSKVKNTWQVNDGVCGFAWITIKPANSAFAKWLMEKNLARKASYGSGVLIWVYQYGQSYERKAAYAGAFAGVLQKYGINAQMGCRED